MCRSRPGAIPARARSAAHGDALRSRSTTTARRSVVVGSTKLQRSRRPIRSSLAFTSWPGEPSTISRRSGGVASVEARRLIRGQVPRRRAFGGRGTSGAGSDRVPRRARRPRLPRSGAPDFAEDANAAGRRSGASVRGLHVRVLRRGAERRLPGPLTSELAEQWARAALIAPSELADLSACSDADASQALNVPPDQVREARCAAA